MNLKSSSSLLNPTNTPTHQLTVQDIALTFKIKCPTFCLLLVCDSLFMQADCSAVLLPGHLYILPPCHTPTEPWGHRVKYFLTQCQDSWQIKFFLLTGTRITVNLLIPLQECTTGFSGNKSSMVRWTSSFCLCFWISKQTPSYTKAERIFLFHTSLVSHCAESELGSILSWHAAIIDNYPNTDCLKIFNPITSSCSLDKLSLVKTSCLFLRLAVWDRTRAWGFVTLMWK